MRETQPLLSEMRWDMEKVADQIKKKNKEKKK